MEYFRQKRQEGLINTKTYDRMIEVVNRIEEEGYKFMDVIGQGAYGSVLKVKNTETREELAAKVVQKEYASAGEVDLWKTLDHQNILQLKDVQYVYYADSYLFVSPVYPKNLEQAVMESGFLTRKNALSQVKEWLKQTLDAVSYLHSANFSHNDIKCDNVLISNNNTAVLSDFGFLCTVEKPIRKYGAPFIYRCPEGRLTESGMTEVDGKKLDVWSIGTMAVELFTGMALLKSFSKWDKGPLSCWYTEVYPVIQNSLQKKNFAKLMKDAFPACKRNHHKVNDALNFITGCLNIVPRKRPTVQELQNHKVFGGKWQCTDDQDDIWKNKVSIHGFNAILKRNTLHFVPGSVKVDSNINQYGDNEGRKTYGETVEDEPVAIIQLDAIREEVDNKQDQVASFHSKSMFADNKPLSSLKEEKNDFDITQHPAKNKESLSSVQNHRISTQQLPSNYDYVFDSPVSSTVYMTTSPPCVSVSDHYLDIPQSSPPSRRQKFRKWCQQKKAAFVGFCLSVAPAHRRILP